MGVNPSSFNGDDACPVEKVSWDDVQRFLELLCGHLGSASSPALPSEVQWEYACRAGTRTPFNLGPNISPRQVNYDGNRPYGGAPGGEDRECTVPVKSLPPNRWGLFEMHGNVWEWCTDVAHDHVLAPADEPQRLLEQRPEAPRAVRGGSWFTGAEYARSAMRRAYPRSDRSGSLGFRLLLGGPG